MSKSILRRRHKTATLYSKPSTKCAVASVIGSGTTHHASILCRCPGHDSVAMDHFVRSTSCVTLAGAQRVNSYGWGASRSAVLALGCPQRGQHAAYDGSGHHLDRLDVVSPLGWWVTMVMDSRLAVIKAFDLHAMLSEGVPGSYCNSTLLLLMAPRTLWRLWPLHDSYWCSPDAQHVFADTGVSYRPHPRPSADERRRQWWAAFPRRSRPRQRSWQPWTLSPLLGAESAPHDGCAA